MPHACVAVPSSEVRIRGDYLVEVLSVTYRTPGDGATLTRVYGSRLCTGLVCSRERWRRRVIRRARRDVLRLRGQGVRVVTAEGREFHPESLRLPLSA